jgi:hypothetical protein
MKNTKIMLVAVSVYIVTYSLFALLSSYVMGFSFHDAVSNTGVCALMVFFGWIPSVVVASDYSDKLD